MSFLRISLHIDLLSPTNNDDENDDTELNHIQKNTCA